MPSYAIVLLYDPPTKPGVSGTIDREERQFANLGEALQRAREMYQRHQKSAIGFQILDAVAAGPRRHRNRCLLSSGGQEAGCSGFSTFSDESMTTRSTALSKNSCVLGA